MSRLMNIRKKFYKRDQIVWVQKGIYLVLALCLYIMISINYVHGNILMERNAFRVFSYLWSMLVLILVLVQGIRIPTKYARCYHILSTVLISSLCFLITESIYNANFWEHLVLKAAVLNILLTILFSFALQRLLCSRKVALHITVFFSYIYGCVNYYLYIFKGNVLRPNELSAWTTGLTVAGNYEYNMSDSMIGAALLLLLAVLFTNFNREKGLVVYKNMGRKKSTVVHCTAGTAALVLMSVFIFWFPWKDVFGLKLQSWDNNASYYNNGGILAFIMEAQEMKIEKPEGYRTEIAEKKLSDYEEGVSFASMEEAPTIICIMNETYSDLSVLGDIDTAEEMQAWNSIEDYIMKGYTYTSIYGAGTCNSEFEFLTGNTMANLSTYAYPYQSYDLKNVFNMGRECADLGYATIAFHPNIKTNWSRDTVYPDLGFDEFVALDSVTNAEYIGKRCWMSDASDYAMIIDMYERAEKPIFLFNVTMQNHANYNIGDMDENNLVDGGRYAQHTDVTAFRTLIRESSQAFYDLLEYFRKVEKPVVICMFGDHLPALNETFVKEITEGVQPGNASEKIEKKEAKYMTPYMIWTNYNIDVEQRENNFSLNYLGAHVLEVAGIHTDYTDYLLDLEKKIPVINAYGYQTEDGEWHNLEEKNEHLEEYSFLEYYMMTR